jgi:hypothetical protein
VIGVDGSVTEDMVAVALITRTANYAETYYLHEDHLGSTDVITKGGWLLRTFRRS